MNPYLVDGLSTPRLVFRRLEPRDFEKALPFFEHPLSHQYWNTGGRDPNVLCREWFDKQQWRYVNARGGAMALVERKSGELVGWCGLLVQEVDAIRELEVGYSIMPAHWRNGYATEGARACLQFAFERNLAESVISIIQVDNLPSQEVAIKNGLTRGRQTTYHGNRVYIYQINREGWNTLNAQRL